MKTLLIDRILYLIWLRSAVFNSIERKEQISEAKSVLHEIGVEDLSLHDPCAI